MTSANFSGRNELLQWINSTLGLHLTKIEQVGSLILLAALPPYLRPPLKSYPQHTNSTTPCADREWRRGMPARGRAAPWNGRPAQGTLLPCPVSQP